MSKYSENRRSRINPETAEVEVETFFQIDPTTIEENRALYTEEEVKYLRKIYGGFFFDKKPHKFGAYTYTCGRMYFTEEASRVTEQVYQTSSKHEQREKEKQEKYNEGAISLEWFSRIGKDGYLDYDILDLRDQYDNLMEDDRTRAIIKALHQAKARYVPIFLLMIKYDLRQSRIAEILGMTKPMVTRDIKKIREIAKG